MEFNKQLFTVRFVYNQLRLKYYSSDFRKKLFLVSSRNPEWYEKEQMILGKITAVIENSILRGNLSRAVHYLVLMEIQLKKINDRVEEDVKKVLVGLL